MMSHRFGDLLHQYLHRKHGLSQSKLAQGIGQDPAVITKMCHGQRLTGPLARERVLAILAWLNARGVLEAREEADALLESAGMARLQETHSSEFDFIKQLTEPIGVGQSPMSPVQALSTKRAQFVLARPKYWLLLIGVALATSWLFVAFDNKFPFLMADDWQDRIVFHGNGWCSAYPVEVGEYGWIGTSLINSTFFDPQVNLLNVDYYVYFEDEYVDFEVIQLRGLNPDRDQWQFTITPSWTSVHINWQDPSKWRIDYECH